MQNFEFHNPTKILFGRNTIGRIGEEIRSEKITKVMLIAGGGSIKRNGVYDQVIRSLRDANLEVIEAWGIRPNPVLSTVRELVAQTRKHKIDGILAVGGGSVIDTAKAVAAGLFVDDPWDLFVNRFNTTPALPLFTVLTLSASGSEFDAGAVITNEEEKKKWFFMNPHSAPKVSVIDPSVQRDLPWYQTVNGVVDAMAHIMEIYVTGGANEVTLGICECLMKTLISAADRLQKDKTDYDARSDLAWAAALALSGLCYAGQSGTDSTPHALEHGLSAHYPDVSHGAGLGVVIPGWIASCAEVKPEMFDRWADRVWDCDSWREANDAFRQRLKQWGHPVTLKELGVDREKLGEIGQNAHDFGLSALVRPLTAEEMKTVLESVY